MTRAVATGDETCQVLSFTGSGKKCRFPIMTTTDECSTKVFIGGIGVVREDDRIAPHDKSGCVLDSSVVTSFSSNVYVEGKGLARIGDRYTSDNIIASGSPAVFAG
jgi:uncharacterized Zn-binding protein involved in type VI secretion